MLRGSEPTENESREIRTMSDGAPLSLDAAIRTALEYEHRVCGLYRRAAEQATEDTGRRIFTKLADEEQGHIDYLQSRFEEWKETGRVSEVELTTALPTRRRLEEAKERLERKVSDYDWTIEIELLRKARQMESETGMFYKQMVAELDDEGKRLFSRFLEIEDAHYDLVQIQLDALNGGGFWFDMPEFALEGA